MNDSGQLLRRYVADGSDDAFQELVTRYIDLVYSVAVRRLGGDTHWAEDAVQTVFTDLARKAQSLRPDSALGGWLHRHTCFVTANFLRAERRRQTHERAAAMNTFSDSSDTDWQQIAPVLDEAIDQLSAPDREAVLLRFFERRDFRAVGAALGTNEDAAQKRVSRAVDKLRVMLLERGVNLSLAGLAALLSGQAVSAAPASLIAQVAHAAHTGASAANFSASFARRLATSTPFKLTVGVGIIAVLTAWWIAARHHKSDVASPTAATTPPRANANATQAASTEIAAFTGSPLVAGDPVAAGDFLRLTLVADDSGKPVPSAVIVYRAWEGNQRTRKELRTARDGVCQIPLPRATLEELILSTQIDDFADTCLAWSPKNGEVIPTNYTVRLTRATPIGGQVIDADGQPLVGASVGFGSGGGGLPPNRPESHEARLIETSTDAEGRWRINRIASELIRHVNGLAQHPEHAPAWTRAAKPEVEQQLRAASHVIRLGRAVAVRGVVVDPNGQPIADAKVSWGKFGSSERRETTSLPDGIFGLKGCSVGRSWLTAEASGFASSTIEVELNVQSEPFRLELRPGKTLRLRVVNASGEPIPDAQIYLNTSARTAAGDTRPGPPLVQINYRPKADRDGRVVWESAPDRELEFDIEAAGYVRRNEFKVRPDGREHVVMLHRGLTISGTVRDEATGAPIPRFRIICGWPRQDFEFVLGGPKTNFTWSAQDQHWLNFGNGQFRHTFGEVPSDGSTNTGFALKFEVDGYQPFISRTLLSDEREARLEVTMQASAATTVTVQLPDGRAAIGAEVGFVSPRANLWLVPGGFSREGAHGGDLLRITDSNGRFVLPPDPVIAKVVVATPAGYAESTPAALRDQPVLRLQLWGRLEGTFRLGKHAAGRTVRLDTLQPDMADALLDFDAFRVTTDADGKFVFPKVPPAALKLWRLIPISGPGGTEWRPGHLADVEVRPGETTTVTVGGSRVITRLRWPAGFARGENWRVTGSVHTPFPTPPAEISTDGPALERWYQSPQLAALMAKGQSWVLAENTDGSLAADDVTPGTYVIDLYVGRTDSTSGAIPSHLMGHATVTVPADPPAGTVDLGEIELQPAPTPPATARPE